MANVSKGLLEKARAAKQRAAEIKHEELTIAYNEATLSKDPDEIQLAREAIDAFNEGQEELEERKRDMLRAKVAVREAKKAWKEESGGTRTKFVEGWQEMVAGVNKPKPQFHAAQLGMLAKVVRDIGRWETASSYDNVRGVRKGEIVMPITDPYDHPYDDDKLVVDVLAGDTPVKGVPAAALRPLSED